MNFFGGQQNTGPSAVTVAKIEADVLNEMFNKMSGMCNKKCITSFTNGELEVGEQSCIDRCTSKYLQAQDKVGTVLKEFEEKMRAQEQLQAQQMQRFGGGR